jgi:hypothetical protein
MTVRTKARVYAVAAVGVLLGLGDIALHSIRHAMGKDAYLASQARLFDRMYSTVHQGRSLVFGVVTAGLFLGLYELIAAGLLAMLQSRRDRNAVSATSGGGT